MEMTNSEINLDNVHFEVGDTFIFKMTDGEKIEAIAVKQIGSNMLFIHTDCLKKEYPMYDEYNRDGYGSYEESDLRKHLNSDIYNKLPIGIKERMVAFDNDDMLSIPTEKQIFDTNEYGEEEGEDITQLSIMKQRKNQIAFQGYRSDEWAWYWLKNKKSNSASHFAGVNSSGDSDYSVASGSGGVRPMFLLKNNQQIEVANGKDNACEINYMEYLKKEYDKVTNEFEQTKETVIQEIKDMTAFNDEEFGDAYASRIDRITKVATKLQTINELLDNYKYFENKRCIS